MITIIVDNVEYQVAENQNLLQACLSVGLDLPYFCWHPAMDSIGACRQCAVSIYQDENDKYGRLNVACMTPVSDGMRLSLQAQNETEFREQVIAALMTNHPHDCPVCAEGGECHLQDMTVMTGHTERRYPGKKRTFENQHLGPLVKHEMNRCITCYRCVRFYKDYAGGTDLAAMASKNHVYFGRHQSGTLESPFAGNLTEVCPTGVFTDKVFGEHFNRKWDLQSAPSVCQHCSVGCNLSIGERYGSLRRVVNRYNPDLNGHFLCDRGRFGFHHVNAPQRRLEISTGEQHTVVSWSHPQLQKNLQQSSKLHWFGIGSPQASLEDNFALRELVGEENFTTLNDSELILAQQHLQLLKTFAAPSLSKMEQADAIIVVAEPIDITAPRAVLAVRQALSNKAREQAARLRIPDWQSAAVKQLMGDNPTPLIQLTATENSLSELATQQLYLPTQRCVILTQAIADRVRQQDGEYSLTAEESTFVDQAAKTLKDAKKPLIISGWHNQNVELLPACENLASAVEQHSDVMLALFPPAANSLGAAWLNGEQNSIETLLAKLNNNSGVISLHSDASKTMVNGMKALQRAKIFIDMANFDGNCSDIAQLRLPLTTFSEQRGTVVNYQSRLQTYHGAVATNSTIKSVWQWCDKLSQAINKENQPTTLELIQDKLQQLIEHPIDCWQQSDQTAARQSPRYSGRTAMLANQTVHEPKPRSDCDSSMAYSMEGKIPADQKQPAYSWFPGWNSNQSAHKLSSNLDSDLLVAPITEAHSATDNDEENIADGNDIRAEEIERQQLKHHANGDNRQENEFELITQNNFYGAEYFSSFAPHLISLTKPDFIQLSQVNAEQLELKEGDIVTLCNGADHSKPLLKVTIEKKQAVGVAIVNYASVSNAINAVKLNGHFQLLEASQEQTQQYHNNWQQTQQQALDSQQEMQSSLLQQDHKIPIHFVGEVNPDD